MEPSTEPPPSNPNLGEPDPISAADLPPDIPTHKVAIRPAFLEPDGPQGLLSQ
jgi:hypothetical protein